MAATPRGIKAGEAYIRLFAEDSALRKGLESAEKRLRAFGTAVAAAGAGLTAVGASALGGLFAAAKTFSDVGDAVDKMNQRTGLSTEAISELGFAAEQEGTNIEELEKGFRKFQQTLGDAAKGNKEAAEAFAAIGLNVEQLLAMSPDEQFYAIADAMSKITDEAVLTEAAMGLLGRGGTMLIPLLTKGSAGIDELRRQARELGLTFDSEAAQSAAALNDALNALNRSLKATWMWIGSAVAPVITEITEAATPLVAGVSRFVRENHGLVVSLGGVAIALTAVGAVLMAAGAAAILAGLALGALSTILGTIAAVGAGVVGFLASTPGMIAAIGLAAASAGSLMIDWRRALQWLGEELDTLSTTARDTFGGIADALRAGDIELAGQTLWAGLELAWTQGTQALMSVWDGLTVSTLTTWNSLWATMQQATNAGVHAVLATIQAGIEAAGTAMGELARTANPGAAAGFSAAGTMASKFLQSKLDALINTVQMGAPGLAGAMRGARAIIGNADWSKFEDARFSEATLRISQELAEAQGKLAQASAEERAEQEAKVDALKAQLEYMRREAELRATEAANAAYLERQTREGMQGVGDAASSLRSVGGFAGRALESAINAIDSDRAKTEKDILRESRRTAENTAKTARILESGVLGTFA